MKSSRSRSRNKNRNNRPTGGNVINRVFDSSGPEGKVRGTPQQIIDKYNQLARDAQLSGDRVATENFQQHAEHYLRLLSEAQKEVDARREEQERQNRERQAERDRERAARQERESSEAPKAPAADNDVAGGGDQPDIVDTSADESSLVETPEDKPRKPKRPRTRRPKAAADEEGGKDETPPAGDAPEAAE
jgi:sRNA-binding protein